MVTLLFSDNQFILLSHIFLETLSIFYIFESFSSNRHRRQIITFRI